MTKILNFIKTNKKNIFIGMITILIGYLGFSTLVSYFSNHSYYGKFLNGILEFNSIFKVILLSLGVGFLIILPFIFFKKIKLKHILFYLLLGLSLFGWGIFLIKSGSISEINIPSFIMISFRYIFVFGLMIYSFLGFYSIGGLVNKFIKINNKPLIFGIGLSIFLLFINFLILSGLLYRVITILIFLSFGILIYLNRNNIKDLKTSIVLEINKLGLKSEENNKMGYIKYVNIILLFFSVILFLFGFDFSFIPYPTARDASHAYMLFPKIWSSIGGFQWGDISAPAPFLWFSYITFFFSVFGKGIFGITSDNISIVANFFSSPFVLIFGLVLIKGIINYFKPEMDKKLKKIIFSIGWGFILMWLLSGMGAFLVFVDNKTDLGVMFLTILAIISGIKYLNIKKGKNLNQSNKKELREEIKKELGKEEKKSKQELIKNKWKYLIISGFLFGVSMMAKPIAFIDIYIFFLFILSLYFGGLFSIGLGILGLGIVGKIGIMYSSAFLGNVSSIYLIVFGIILIGISLIYNFFKSKYKDKNNISGLKEFGILSLVFLSVLFIFKGPFLAYGQIQNGEFNLLNFGKGLFVSYVEPIKEKINNVKYGKKNIDKNIIFEKCEENLKNLDNQELYRSLQEPTSKGTSEDIGRYVGFGWKRFSISDKGISKIIYSIFNKVLKNGCSGWDKDSILLCQNEKLFNNEKIKEIISLKSKMDKEGKLYQLIEKLEQKWLNNPNESISFFKNNLIELNQYYQWNSLKKDGNNINIPFKYLVPLNITFNWSLQNETSYYTDIGFIWFLSLIILLFSIIYYIFTKNKIQRNLSIFVVLGWVLWWIVGGGILWYGIGLIIWTIINNILFLGYIIDGKDIKKDIKDSKMIKNKNLAYSFIIVLGFFMLLQMILNYIRISSQGHGGSFQYYKSGVGKMVTINNKLETQIKNIYGYSSNIVFNGQFGKYRKVIKGTENRSKKEGILLAGTYSHYFLKDYKNIRLDGLLSWFSHKISDGDSCRSYLRLKNNNIKYLIIDPNIGSVVKGEGNKTLFYKFFGKIKEEEKKFIDYGAIGMLIKMTREGYLKLEHTNNIALKYALELDDEEFKKYYGTGLDLEQLLLIRSKLGVLRFFEEDSEKNIGFVLNQVEKRIGNGEFIYDIIDISGVNVDGNKIIELAKKGINKEINQNDIESLNNDEREVLLQYLNVFTMFSSKDKNSYEKIYNYIMKESLISNIQISFFSLN